MEKSETTEIDSLCHFDPLARKFLSELRLLNDQLLCRICMNLFVNPVIAVKCGHNFCSLCIRKYLNHNQKCPECNDSLHEQELKPNRVVREIKAILVAKLFPKIAISLDPNWKKGVNEDSNQTSISQPNEEEICVPVNPVDLHIADEDSSMSSVVSVSSNATDHLSVSSNSNDHPQSKHSKTNAVNDANNVSCPVCSVTVAAKYVNSHLDRCLNSGQSQQRKAKKNKIKPMQKLVYHLMKDSELKRKLKEIGLDAKGDKKTLIDRHKRFVTLWNAQCDSDAPLSKMQILMQVQREEVAEKKENDKTANNKNHLLNFDRNSDPMIIEKKKKEYLKENKDSFTRLIREVKERRKKTLEQGVENQVIHEPKPSTSKAALQEEAEKENLDLELRKNSRGQSPSISTPDIFDISDDENCETTQADKASKTSLKVTKDDTGGLDDGKSTFSPVKKSPSSRPFFTSPKKSGELYITPKKSTLVEIASRSSSSRQKSIVTALEDSAKKKKALRNKSACPVCTKQVPTALLNGHLDRCLESNEKKYCQPEETIEENLGRKRKSSESLLIDEDLISTPGETESNMRSSAKSDNNSKRSRKGGSLESKGIASQSEIKKSTGAQELSEDDGDFQSSISQPEDEKYQRTRRSRRRK